METEIQKAVYDYSMDFERWVFGSFRPSINVYEALKRARTDYFEIERVLNWDDEKKEELLEFLTDIVSMPELYEEDFDSKIDEIEGKIGDLKEFEEFYRLKDHFDRMKLDPVQKKAMVKSAIIRLIGYTDLFTRKITYTMNEAQEDDIIKDLFISGSLLRLINRLLNYFLNSNESEYINTATILILRFAAFVKGKITRDDLMTDISMNTKHIRDIDKVLSNEDFKNICGSPLTQT